ncbi:hypothetical protein DPMN_024601, partial [Dreissena polymorpha]
FCYGDPHIRTLDQRDYTFNGLGEYILFQIYDINASRHVFQLQGRTEVVTSATNSSNRLNATVFAAFAAEDKIHGGYFHVEINLKKDGFIIYSDTFNKAVDCSLQFLSSTQPIMYSNVAIQKNSNTSMDISLTNGITVNVKLSEGLLDLSMTIPPVYKLSMYRSTGLYGNNDGDSNNEFNLPDGTVLPNNMTDRMIHNYAEQWNVTSQTRLFHYSTGKPISATADPTFYPIFLDEIPKSNLTEAMKVCGGEASNIPCLFDFIATLNAKLAANTNAATKESEFIALKAGNTATSAQFVNPVRYLSATVNETVIISYKASDPDSDNITLFFEGPTRKNKTGFQNVSDSYTWTPLNTTPVNISVFARDDLSQSSVQFLSVLICSGCSGNGVCNFDHEVAREVTCKCNIGWGGPACNVDINGCEGNPCPIGSKCIDITPQQQQSVQTGYRCSCQQGYINEGSKCLDIDECQRTPSPCAQICTNTEGSYTCSCRSGYAYDAGDKTCNDLDECRTGLTGCQQKCINLPGSYRCDCQANHTLQADGRTCKQDVTLEQLCIAKKCQHGCQGSQADVKCFCNTGFSLASDSISCNDINECDKNPCSQKCSNLDGAFLCSCYDGFKLSTDKISCEPCREGTWGTNCSNACICIHAVSCDSVKGCVCQAGWYGTQCNMNVNECVRNPCTAVQTCVDTDGSYTCDCVDGFQKLDNETCENINECILGGNNKCDPDRSTCIDLSPGYSCSCSKGYIANGDKCDDIDECATKHDCEHTCINVVGNYNCKCFVGYILQDNRRTCIASSDRCAGHQNGLNFTSCTTMNFHGCMLNDSGDAVCFCRKGFDNSGNGCIDTDECAGNGGRGVCKVKCLNLPGSFLCSCNNGERLLSDGISCEACNTTDTWGSSCENKCSCGQGALYCDSIDGCQCRTGWNGTKCDVDINECLTNPCGNNQNCMNTFGSYYCECNTGYHRNVSNKCEDVDECSSPTKNYCSQRCDNNMGSYTCACRQGFQFAPGSNRECININECNGAHGCEHGCLDNEGNYQCYCRQGFRLESDNKSCRKDETQVDPCSTFNTTCGYGCVTVNGSPRCFCPANFKLNPEDNSTCLELNNKLWVKLVLSLPYDVKLQSNTSVEFKNNASDLSSGLKRAYSNLPGVVDIGIFAILPEFVVLHTVLFNKDNITDTDVTALASLLRFIRYDQGYIAIYQTNTSIVQEPSIANTLSGPFRIVTCLVCSHTCLLLNVTRDTYLCESLPDFNMSARIEIQMQKIYIPAYGSKTSRGYSALRAAVVSSFISLFGSLPGEGAMSQGRQMQVRTHILFNSTVTSAQKTDIASRLVALETQKCVFLDDECVLLVGQSRIIGTDGPIIAVCQTCKADQECRLGIRDRYDCVPLTQVTPTSKSIENFDLLLGLGLGVPLFILSVFLLFVCFLFCLRRRRQSWTRQSLSSENSDPYNVRPAFGSVSSELSGRNNASGPFSRRYKENWEAFPEEDENISYYRDPLLIPAPYIPIYPSLAGAVIEPNEPVDEPVRSNFSWDILYDNNFQPNNAFRIERPVVETKPADVFRDSRRQTYE